MTSSDTWPYNLPIFRQSHAATSPDGQWQAKIAQAYEISMSNPTVGKLNLSDGFVLPRCNPSFLWSDDSRYLAVAQVSYILGLLFAVRVLVIAPRERTLFASRRYQSWIQPQTFIAGRLTVSVDPCGTARDVQWTLPEDLARFKPLAYARR